MQVNDEKPYDEINITPMLDLAYVLLVIFILMCTASVQGLKVNLGGEAMEGYHVVFGGGSGADAGIGKQVFTGIPFGELPVLLERVLKTYLAKRQPHETFVAFTRRHDVKQLQEMFSE